MANGLLCCLHGVCCPPATRLKTWTVKIKAWVDSWSDKALVETDDSDGIAAEIASKILAEHDPAPLGMADTVMANWDKPDAELGAAVRALYQTDFYHAQGNAHS